MEAYTDWFNLIPILMMTIVMVGVVFFLVLPMNNIVDELKDRQVYHSIDRVDILPIETLQSDMSISGHFMLGSGSINGKTIYSYYIKTSNGGYVLQQVDASMSTIYMDENAKPYLTKHYSETDRLKKQFISSYSFHVPTGTIVRTYDVMK